MSENRADHAEHKVDRRRLRSTRPKLEDVLPTTSGGKAWEFVHEPRCRVCSAGDGVLELVNRLLISGLTYSDVLRALESVNHTRPKGRRISYQSIRNHQKKHMPFEAQAYRDILERRAAEAERDFIEGTGSIVTSASYAEVVMRKSFDHLMTNDIPVDVKDGLAAAKLLYAIDAGRVIGMDEAQALEQLNRIIEAVRAVCTPEQMTEIAARLETPQAPELETLDEVLDEEDEFDPEPDGDDETA